MEKINISVCALTQKHIKSLAEFDERSMNGEILYLIRLATTPHEQKHGELR